MIPEDEKPEETPSPEGDQEAPKDDQEAPEADETVRMREELEEALREKDQFRTMAQRSQADLVNYKRRAAEELLEVRRSAKAELLLKVLSVADDLERALSLVPDDAVASGWLDGLRLVQRNLANVLDSEGITKIEAEGQPFEPWEHEAVLYEETPDGPQGMVIRVIREGYKLRDRVLRPAQVAVSRGPEPEAQPEDTQQEA